MSTVSFNGLLIISVIAVAAPVLAANVRRVKVPSPVVEIVAGILVGPAVLGWVKIDQPITVVSLLGLAFLLFLAGLEIDLTKMTPSKVRAPVAGFVGSLALGTVAGVAFHTAGWVRDPLFLAITLASTSLGLVVPVLADAGLTETALGQVIIVGATAGEFGAITLLSLFFSEAKGGALGNMVAFGIFGAMVAVMAVTPGRADRNIRLEAFLTRPQDTTAEIRVRIAVALLIGFVALAAKPGLQTILGAFLAGVVLNLVDRDGASHPVFRSKLNTLGYGFMIPLTCGIEDRLYHHRRCVRCCLAERAARLLSGRRLDLVGVYDAIVAARQPYSAHNWLRSAVAAGILAEVASGALAVSHAALDAHPRPRAAGFLRQLLVAHDVLPARDEALVALEAWVADQLRRVDDASQRRLLRSYATWRVLRRARTRAASKPRPRTAIHYAKTNLLAPIAFLGWLTEGGITLSNVGQVDIDNWIVQGGPSAHELADFLDWAIGRKLLAPIVLTARRPRQGTTVNPDTRWEIVDRLLHDDHLAVGDRVAGCLVLLYAQQLTHIVALTVNQVVTADDSVHLTLGASQTIIPEPLGGLLVELATRGRTHTGIGSPASSHWLFPGLHAGRPLHPSGLGQRLRRLGIPTMLGRRAALMHLASQLPAAVLAEILHLQPATAVRWVAAAGGDWNKYAAEISRNR